MAHSDDLSQALLRQVRTVATFLRIAKVPRPLQPAALKATQRFLALHAFLDITVGYQLPFGRPGSHSSSNL